MRGNTKLKVETNYEGEKPIYIEYVIANPIYSSSTAAQVT